MGLQGSLVNPANGKSVELKWIKQNGKTSFEANGAIPTVYLALDGHFLRDYADAASSILGMNLPADGAAVGFQVGEHSENPWAYVCGLLS